MIKTEIILPLNYSSEDIKNALCETAPIRKEELSDVKILKKALLLSDKSNIRYKVSVGICLSAEREAGLLKMRKKFREAENLSLSIPKSELEVPPVVVGAGPAGLFAALTLAKAGACPIVIERGLSVDERRKKVEAFKRFGILDTECNIQFGEGGAGTFSDGKLKYGAMDALKKEVLTEFVSAGADEDILYTVGAHLGTDKLSEIVKNIREKIISLGGKFIFGARLDKILAKASKIVGLEYIKDGKCERIETENLVLAVGHSANDVFELLYSMGVPLEARPFGVGVRIEHKREYIDGLVYGTPKPASLGAASYHLVTHLPSGRSVYSFCMCPGGTVVAAANEEGGVVTNGMSEYARDAENSNSALLVSVTPEDFGSESVLAGLEYRRKIERAAYLAAGGDFKAPITRLDDFLEGSKPREPEEIKPSYPRGVSLAPCEEYLPDYIVASIREAICDFDAWLPGFKLDTALITGAETRTTSPVRILRADNMQCPTLSGLFPSGEGAGYAGGIVSSAADGVKTALAVLCKE